MTNVLALNEILELIMKGVITALAGTFAGAVVIWIKNVRRKDKVNSDALKALAHDSFHRQCRILLAQDSITEDELENLNYLHDCYEALGLNGTGEELYQRCRKKPIRQ